MTVSGVLDPFKADMGCGCMMTAVQHRFLPINMEGREYMRIFMPEHCCPVMGTGYSL